MICLVICTFVEILGGGFPLGSLVMVMEDIEAPHHMLLLRNFMSQGLVHNQPLLYASPSSEPRSFLGTLPSPVLSKDDKSRDHDPEQVSLSPVSQTCVCKHLYPHMYHLLLDWHVLCTVEFVVLRLSVVCRKKG